MAKVYIDCAIHLGEDIKNIEKLQIDLIDCLDVEFHHYSDKELSRQHTKIM